MLLRNMLRVSKLANVIAGSTLTFMMLITVADVILRAFRKPIFGTYELVAFSGAVVIGLSLPFTSWTKGHIQVDFLIQLLSKRVKKILNISTRVLGICFFLLGGWYLIKMGMKIYKTGELSLTLQIPFHPIVYLLGICCFIQCLVLVCDIVRILRGEYE